MGCEWRAAQLLNRTTEGGGNVYGRGDESKISSSYTHIRTRCVINISNRFTGTCMCKDQIRNGGFEMDGL